MPRSFFPARSGVGSARMHKPLSGRRALVTGASAGIGAAIARSLSAAGAELWLVARRAEKLQALASELGSAHALPLDVCDADAVARAIAGLPLDILVDNAGLAIGVEKLSQGDPAEWSRVLDTNVKGVLNV